MTATELSAPGIERLRRLGARVFVGDVRDACYRDAAFDLVVALEVLEHLPDPLALLREFGRVTRPGGILLASTPNFDGLSRRLLGLSWRVIAAEHLGYFNRLSLHQAVEWAGYAQLTVESRSLDMAGWRSLSRELPRFDPLRAAQLRDRVQERPALRVCRDIVNHILDWTKLGDTLLVWARR